jgi:hypothetical protein
MRVSRSEDRRDVVRQVSKIWAQGMVCIVHTVHQPLVISPVMLLFIMPDGKSR